MEGKKGNSRHFENERLEGVKAISLSFLRASSGDVGRRRVLRKAGGRRGGGRLFDSRFTVLLSVFVS